MKTLNFNTWIKTQKDTGTTPLAAVWVAQRGRLSREAVEQRSQLQYGQPVGVGYGAWDAFVAARGISGLLATATTGPDAPDTQTSLPFPP